MMFDKSTRGFNRPCVKARQTGMTLIEVVIALVLFALIALALVSAMSTMGQTLTRTTQRIDQVNDMRIITRFLRQTVGEPQPFFLAGPDGANEDFNGEANQLTFVGNLTGYQGPGGLHFIHLYVNQDAASDKKELMMQFARWYPPMNGKPNQAADFSQSKPQLLIKDVTDFSIHYLSPEGSDDWQSEWKRLDRYPAAIRLSVAVNGRYWPEIVMWIGAARNGR